jgi:hypothetical protein
MDASFGEGRHTDNQEVEARDRLVLLDLFEQVAFWLN